MPGSRRAWLLWPALAVALAAIAETGLRTWAHHFRSDFEAYDGASGAWVLRPGTHRTPSGGSVEVNPAGFVGAPLETDSEGLVRIAAFGDSCTFGAGTRIHTYPAALQRVLVRSHPETRIEVVNAGISGLDTAQVAARLRSVGERLSPDLILIYAGWNDLMKRSPGSQSGRGIGSTVRRALDDLWLVRGLRKLLFYHLRPRLGPPDTGSHARTGRFEGFVPDVFEAELQGLISTSRGLGALPVLLTLPTPLRIEADLDRLRRQRIQFPYFAGADNVADFLDLIDAYNRAIRRRSVESSTPLVDLASVFQDDPDASRYFYDVMHANEDGMQRIAQRVAEVLETTPAFGMP